MHYSTGREGEHARSGFKLFTCSVALFRLVRWAARAAFGPGPHQGAERGLRASRWRPSAAGPPGPAHQTVFRNVVKQRSHVPATVPRRILDLLADRTERTALPPH